MIARPYTTTDYEAVAELYKRSDTYGGQYADERDSENRLHALSQNKPNSILVAEVDGQIVGTVTLFEDGRAAWLFRFAVDEAYEEEASQLLFEKAAATLRALGHEEVQVYAPAGKQKFQQRYESIGFQKGNDYTAYWQSL